MKKIILILTIFAFLFSLVFWLFSISELVNSNLEPSIKKYSKLLFRKQFIPDYFFIRGIVVLYKQENSNTDFVGRIIAKPHEAIRIKDNNIYVKRKDGVWLLEEEYLPSKKLIPVIDNKTWYRLGSDEYLILPDNRSEIIDIEKRIFSRDKIKGILIKVF